MPHGFKWACRLRALVGIARDSLAGDSGWGHVGGGDVSPGICKAEEGGDCSGQDLLLIWRLAFYTPTAFIIMTNTGEEGKMIVRKGI